MIPLHPGHPEHELALIVALSVVLVAGAFALTREGWTRVGALLGVGVLAVASRVVIEGLGIHAHGVVHLAGHGVELGAVVCIALAGYYALSDAMETSTARS